MSSLMGPIWELVYVCITKSRVLIGTLCSSTMCRSVRGLVWAACSPPYPALCINKQQSRRPRSDWTPCNELWKASQQCHTVTTVLHIISTRPLARVSTRTCYVHHSSLVTFSLPVAPPSQAVGLKMSKWNVHSLCVVIHTCQLSRLTFYSISLPLNVSC